MPAPTPGTGSVATATATDGRGNTTTYTYDAAERITRVDYSDAATHDVWRCASVIHDVGGPHGCLPHTPVAV